MDLQNQVNNLIQLTLTNSASNDHKCPHCGKEKRFIEVEFFGKKRTVPVNCCEWQEEQKKIKAAEEYEQKMKTEKLFSISNMGERLEKATFDTYIQREGTEQAVKMARKYALGFESYGPTSLLLWGEPGNGKSHLAGAISHDLQCKGKIVVFQSVPELLEKIRNTFRSQKESEKEIMQALQQCDLLILDDIGAEKPSDWVLDVLFRIVDGRYRKEKPILYTSNLKPSELVDKLGRRIYDRILETTLPIQNKASSYRELKARERFEQFRRGEFENR